MHSARRGCYAIQKYKQGREWLLAYGEEAVLNIALADIWWLFGGCIFAVVATKPNHWQG